MRHFIHKMFSLACAVLATAMAASVIQTQLNLGSLARLGAPIDLATRATGTLEDLARFGPVMAGITLAAFLPALLTAERAGRAMGRAHRIVLAMLAGVAGLCVAFWVIGMFSPMPALVAATGTPAGLASVCLTGALGGALYARMSRTRAAGHRVFAHGDLRALLPLLSLVLIPLVLFISMAPRTPAPVAQIDPSQYVVETIAAGLDRPWSVAFLPDGRRLVTERWGRLLAIAPGGTVSSIALDKLPPVLDEGGAQLMSLVVDPAFEDNSFLYLTMGYGKPGANGTRLVRARLAGDRIDEVKILFSSTLKPHRSNNGGALAFLPDGTLVMAVGDGELRAQAQNQANHIGKLVRIDREGRVPGDNPFAGRLDAAAELYSIGHRNPQGMAFDQGLSSLIVTEHGARGGDEINVIKAGANYGWPMVTDGIDYSFARITPFLELDGKIKPIFHWSPSIAPGGLAIYEGALFPAWQGDLLVPALKGRSIRRIVRRQGRIVGEQELLAELNDRIRDVKVAPDGSIHVLTDGPEARLLRLIPAPPKA